MIPGTGRVEEPLCIGSGVIQAGFHLTREGLGEHERGGGLELAAEQVRRADRFEAERPPGLATGEDLGQFHRAPCFLARPLSTQPDWPAGQRKPADVPRLSDQPPTGWVTAAVAGRAEGKGPLEPGLHATASTPRHIEDSWAPLVRLHLKCRASAELH